MALRGRGFDAVVAAPAPAFGGDYLSGRSSLPEYVRVFQRHRVADLLAEVAPEVVVLMHWGMAHEVPPLDVPLAIDLAGPHLLERYYWGTQDLVADAELKLSALRRADFVTCSGAYQRHYFYAWLALAGFELREQEIPIIPFSVPPEEQWPAAVEREPHSFVYGGMLLAWQDPSRGLRLLLDEMARAGRGRLHLFTGSHPVLDASGGHLAALLAELRGHPRVAMHGVVPFDELMRQFAGFSVAFDLMARNPERELAFTTRTMMYLTCGLPVIYNDYAELAELLRGHGGGWTLSPDDEDAQRSLFRRLLSDEVPLEEIRHQAQALARLHTWDRTIGPLAQFCAAPAFRAKKTRHLLRVETLDRELAAEREKRERLEHELASIRGKLLFRVAARLGALRKVVAPLLWLALWPACWYVERALLRHGRPGRP
jgi:glycosyltransferase involved in cell wall biosynthesis